MSINIKKLQKGTLQNQVLSWDTAANDYTPKLFTNNLSSTINTLSIEVNSVVTGSAPIINSNIITLNGQNLTTTVNGILSNTIALPTSVPETASQTPSTSILADATHIGVPSTNTQGAIDDLSKAIKALPVATSATVTNANNGLSLNGSNVVLGNATSGTSAILTSDREIPTAGFNLSMTGAGNFGIRRSPGFPAQASLHIGQTSTSGAVGGNSIILTNNISTTANIGANTITNGTGGQIKNESFGSVILSGSDINLINTLGAINNNNDGALVSASNRLDVEATQGGVALGVKHDTSAFAAPGNVINNKLVGKYTSVLLATTNAFIGSDIQNFYHDGDNNGIIGGNNNAIGYSLNLTNNLGVKRIAPTLPIATKRYVDDSWIIGSEYSEILNAGNVAIISGQDNKVDGMVRSTLISSDNANIVGTTRGVTGGQVTAMSSLNANLKDVSYSTVIATKDANIEGSVLAVKDRSVAIAGNGLKVGGTDQLVQGTYNEALFNTSLEIGIGTTDLLRKNAFAVTKSGATVLGNFTTANEPFAIKGGRYYNTNLSKFLKCNDGTNWVIEEDLKLPTLTVGPNSLSDFLDLQSALNAAAVTYPTGCLIWVKNNIYVSTATYIVKSSNVNIHCESEATRFQCNGVAIPTFIKMDPLLITVEDFEWDGGTIVNTAPILVNVGGSGIAFDLSNFSRSKITDRTFISAFDKGLYFKDTNNTTFYNKYECYSYDCNFIVYIDPASNPVNFNKFNIKAASINDAKSGNTGYYITNAENNTFYECACEPKGNNNTRGIYFGTKTKTNIFIQCYLENNGIGVEALDSNLCMNNGFISGNISLNYQGTVQNTLTEVVDPGNRLKFDGTTIGLISYSNTIPVKGFNTKNGLDIFIDTSTATNKGISIKNGANFAHSGDLYAGQFINGSDNGNIFVADQAGTGNNFVGKNNGITTFSVDKTGNITGASMMLTTLPVYATNALAVADVALLSGSMYYVVVSGYKQVFIK